MQLLSIAGVRLRLNPLFLVVLLVFIFLGLFYQSLVVLAMVLIHEAAHLLFAHTHGMRIREVELLPFGGVVRMGTELELNPVVEFRVALVGPLVSLVLAGFFGGLFQHGGPYREVYSFLFQVNLTLGLFNLLPALPLDGGRMLRAHLKSKMGFYQASSLVALLTRIIALLMVAVTLYGLYLGRGNITLLMVAFFVYYTASVEHRELPTLLLQYLLRQGKNFKERGYARAAVLVAWEDLSLNEVLQLFIPQKYHLVLVIDQEQRLKGLLLEVQIVEHLLEGRDHTITLGGLLERVS